ncbi:hypothetical protein [Labrys neptuniae]
MTKGKAPYQAWDEKYAALTAAAQEIIEREVSEREKKTAHLKELRLAQKTKMPEKEFGDKKSRAPAFKSRGIKRAQVQR